MYLDTYRVDYACILVAVNVLRAFLVVGHCQLSCVCAFFFCFTCVFVEIVHVSVRDLIVCQIV